MSIRMLRNLFSSASRRFPGVSRRKTATCRRGSTLALERLDERCLLAVFTVTTTDDAGPGSLRQAILDANANPGLDTIAFAIGDGGVQTIHPSSALPTITDPVILDGTTQPGFDGQPLIVLDGSSAMSTTGLSITTGGCTVRGLVIQAFNSGILLQAGNNTIAGNYLGTDVTGTRPAGSGSSLVIESSNNLVGGTTAADRNLFSGVTILAPTSGPDLDVTPSQFFPTGNRVQGNYIGTDVSGTAALGNGTGVTLRGSRDFVVSGNLIGGTEPGAGNLISGNVASGISMSVASGNVVQGNWIGTDITGTRILANGSYGIDIDTNFGRGTNNLLGGATAGARNLISGNRSAGIHMNGPNQVQGNWIGTDSSGTAALGNPTGISVEASGVTIGGTQPGAGNLVAGSLNYGVFLAGSNNQILGNIIGTDASGTYALRNGFGVYFMGGVDNRVGGLESGAGNLISGNLTGIVIFSSRGTTVQNNSIGTDAAGSQAIGNVIGVDIRGADTLIGGTSPGAGNLISGNSQIGVVISGSGTRVQGNTIGTDLTGSHALANGDGVYLTAGTDSSTIGGTESGAGNLISGNSDAGVVLSGDRNVVAGNWIGTDRSGTARLRNTVGVRIDGTGNTVGGTVASARNLISGNLSQGVGITGNANVLEGNYIGTDATGTLALGNGTGGITFRAGVLLLGGQNNRIGGTAAGSGNLISANVAPGGSAGIDIEGSNGTLIQGNAIGADVTGTRALGNYDGVLITRGQDNTVGGTVAGAGNRISGNQQSGVALVDAGSNLIQGNMLGLDVTGSAALPNGAGISIISARDNLIGGTEAAARNVISGNTGAGISIFESSDRVQGNYIGTDSTGTQALGNSIGVDIGFASGNTVGGTLTGAGNVISGNRSSGIHLYGFPFSEVGNVLQGNWIGTNSSGTQALGNGIGVDVEEGSSNHLIGGTEPGARNVISGNTSSGIRLNGGNNNRVQGNSIGTDVTGTLALSNGTGVSIGASSSNTIGGTESGAGNLISGNRDAGVVLSGDRNIVAGNWIGTDRSGTAPLRNTVGVRIDGAGNTVGGTMASARNLISGNLLQGVGITGNANVLEGNYIGTDATGTLALGNGMGGITFRAGVLILGGQNNRIGGTAAGAGNLISGNVTPVDDAGIDIEGGGGTLIQGNYIGTDVTGTRALGNGDGGILIYHGFGHTIGGTTTGAGNLISGNRGAGIGIFRQGGPDAQGDLIQGNSIGTDVTGTTALPNLLGIYIQDGTDCLIGGTEPAARNLISGNLETGAFVLGGQGNRVQGNYIGTDRSGTHALGNGEGVVIDADNTVGGTTSGAGNVIAGNRSAGVDIIFGAVVQGNYIGTDLTGTHAVGNLLGVFTGGGTGSLIGGTEPGAGNLISGNTSYGIHFQEGTNHVKVQGNFIGTDITGTLALGNNVGLSLLASPSITAGNTIGGTEPGAGNLISGNRSNGIMDGNHDLIQGNSIGTDISGTLPLGNGGNGILLLRGDSDNTIGGTQAGAANRIAFNRQDGVLVRIGVRNAIRQNAIFANGRLGIELTNGGNRMQAAPVLTSAVSAGGLLAIQGTLTSAPSTTFTIELFANSECDPSGFGQGERFVASLTVATDGGGMAGFTLILAIAIDPGQFLTATATDPQGNTSQFSNCVPVTMAEPPPGPHSPGSPTGPDLPAGGPGSPAVDLSFQKSNWSMFSFVNVNGLPSKILSPWISTLPSRPAWMDLSPGLSDPVFSAWAAWTVR